MKCKLTPVALAVSLLAASYAVVAAPQDNTQLLPTGQFISPQAIPGAVQQLLNPQLAAKPGQVVSGAIKSQLSPDGNTLAVITAGYNTVYTGPANSTIDKADSTQYVFIYDVSGANKTNPKFIQAIHQNNAFGGLAWNGNNTLYGTGGADDKVYVYNRASADPAATWSQTAAIALNHGNKGLGSGVLPNAGGLAVTANGKTLVVANNYNDSITMIDTTSNTVVSEYDLRPYNTSGAEGVAGGEYPWAVSVKDDGTAFVSSVRDREVVVLNLSNPAAPQFIARVPVGGSAYGMSFSPDQAKLYVAVSGNDRVDVIDTTSHQLEKSILIGGHIGEQQGNGQNAGDRKYSGRDTIAVTVSKDGKTLYAVNSGDNSVAVISLDGNNGYKVKGLIPTAYQPMDLTLSADGSQMYIINAKSATGPNPLRAFGTQAQYQFGLEQSSLVSAPVPSDTALVALTSRVTENNGYSIKASQSDIDTMKFLHDHIKHVIFIVKENRTFDQMLGDLGNGSNGDPSLTMFGKSITPNFHNIAGNFVTLDNFMNPGDGSLDGWSWVQHAHVTPQQTVAQQENYAGVERGMGAEATGKNRGVPVAISADLRTTNAGTGWANDTAKQAGGTANAMPGFADVSKEDAPFGYQKASIYEAALEAGLTIRNYGGLVANKGSLGTKAAPNINPFANGTIMGQPLMQALVGNTDLYYRGFDQTYPDTFRELEWNREFQQYVANGNLPAFELVRMGADHTGNQATNVGGMDSSEREEADNDYAVGKLIERVAHSPYAKDTLIISVEDDSQAGSDHVDSHRSTTYVVGPYVKKHAIVSTPYSQVNALRTMEDILGTQHINLNTAYAKPMADVFDITSDGSWDYTAVASTILQGTTVGNVATGSTADGFNGNQYVAGDVVHSLHDGKYWAAVTAGMDFSKEDRIDPALFNRVLWKGVMGDKPYPVPHSIYKTAAIDTDD
jgi:DNA-binding beta-propeller fold protein YncE